MSYPTPFATLPCVDGFDVILSDTGRAVGHRDTLRSANGVAQMMNARARRGDLCTVLAGSGLRTTNDSLVALTKWYEES